MRKKLFKVTQHLVKDTAEPLSAFRPQQKQVNQLKIKFKDRQNELHETRLDEKAAQMVQKKH